VFSHCPDIVLFSFVSVFLVTMSASGAGAGASGSRGAKRARSEDGSLAEEAVPASEVQFIEIAESEPQVTEAELLVDPAEVSPVLRGSLPAVSSCSSVVVPAVSVPLDCGLPHDTILALAQHHLDVRWQELFREQNLLDHRIQLLSAPFAQPRHTSPVPVSISEPQAARRSIRWARRSQQPRPTCVPPSHVHVSLPFRYCTCPDHRAIVPYH
jgi:hypothetical protein